MKGEQLPLSVQLRQTPELDNFFVGPNADAVQALRDLAGKTSGAILLFGAERSGKTHLLQATARAGVRAIYLPLRTLLPSGVEGLAGAVLRDPICIDDVETVCGREAWELALLRLLDDARAHHARLLLSATAAPTRLPLCLPDLRTRLEASAVIGLKPLRDSDRRALLLMSASRRGLEISDEVIAWLLNRCARDAGSLLTALEELDRAALSAQRRLTVPFLQQTLRWPPALAPASGRNPVGSDNPERPAPRD